MTFGKLSTKVKKGKNEGILKKEEEENGVGEEGKKKERKNREESRNFQEKPPFVGIGVRGSPGIQTDSFLSAFPHMQFKTSRLTQ